MTAENLQRQAPTVQTGRRRLPCAPSGHLKRKNIATGVARRESAEEADGKWWPAPLRGVPASRVVRRIGGKRARIDNFGWSPTMRLAHAQSCRGVRSKSGVLAAQRRFPARCVGSNEQTLHRQTAARKQKKWKALVLCNRRRDRRSHDVVGGARAQGRRARGSARASSRRCVENSRERESRDAAMAGGGGAGA